MVQLLPAVVLWLTLTGPAAAAEFVDGIEDVPVMNGMHQVQSNNISFGNDEIRFVELISAAEKQPFPRLPPFMKKRCLNSAGISSAAETTVCISKETPSGLTLSAKTNHRYW